MKILHIISGDAWGGAESMASHLMKTLMEYDDVSISAILFNEGKLSKILSEAGILTYIINEKTHSHINLLINCHKLIKTINPDLIHTHKQKENVIGSICSLSIGIPSIRTVHGSPEFIAKPTDGIKFAFRILNHLTAKFIQKTIVVVSNDLYSKEKKCSYNHKLTIIPNGIDVESIRYVRNNQNRENDTFKHIAIIGRLASVKRIDIFIELASILASAYPNKYRFSIYGEGPLRQNLISQCELLNVSPMVTFKGFVSDMANEYAKIDLIAITSDHEGLPMNLLEAIAAEIPVISRNVGDVRKVLCDGTCGIIIDSDDPAEFAINIDRFFMMNKEDVARITSHAFQQLTEHYTVEKMSNSYYDLYTKSVKS